jgi:hypothetical protein
LSRRDYLGGPNVVIRALIRGRQMGQNEKRRVIQPQAEECRQFVKLKKARNVYYPLHPSEDTQPC